jgi:hypothetical protein
MKLHDARPLPDGVGGFAIEGDIPGKRGFRAGGPGLAFETWVFAGLDRILG